MLQLQPPARLISLKGSCSLVCQRLQPVRHALWYPCIWDVEHVSLTAHQPMYWIRKSLSISWHQCSGITPGNDLSKVKIRMNCQDVSQSAQGRDKSRQTYLSLQRVLELMSFVLISPFRIYANNYSGHPTSGVTYRIESIVGLDVAMRTSPWMDQWHCSV